MKKDLSHAASDSAAVSSDNESYKSQFAQFEEHIVDFWEEKQTFQQSIDQRSAEKSFVFYDGPPFATGLPHYGHMLASTVKDSVPRFWTMRGYKVERRWGWDCHGLPVENLIEKEFGLNSRKDIEEYGIDKFNDACRASVLKYDKEWGKFVKRMGRWVDFDNSYKTMDNSYMESVWWAFSEMYKKDLAYEGRRVSLYCPRCATPLSNFEIAMDNSYKNVTDSSITVKLPVIGEDKTFLLAWTTTPWTLPGNVALVVNQEEDYVKVQRGEEYFYCSAVASTKLFEMKDGVGRDGAVIVETVKGSALIGKTYTPLYEYLVDGAEESAELAQKSFEVFAGDFVEMSEGTGIVHMAPLHGEDDFRMAQEHNLVTGEILNEQGNFRSEIALVAGKFFKDAEQDIINDLQERGLVFEVKPYKHSYPHCWRCETPLYYYAGPAWFFNVQELKPQMIENNKPIDWKPDHLKEGRFGKGIEQAPDWNISRSRFWGTAIPVWKCTELECEHIDVVGSVAELSEKAGRDLSELDLHRPYIDDVKWDCSQCGGAQTMKRIAEVFDCWVESGSMPFAEQHYPFENKETFEARYPADFISEYIAQTRGWFYTLHVLSTGLFNTPAFKHAVTTGTMMGDDGQKMSKSKKNYPEPQLMFDKYCVDAMRFYLLSSPIMDGAKVNFSEHDVAEIYKKTINTLWNVFTFYKLFAGEQVKMTEVVPEEVTHELDKWILARLDVCLAEVTTAYENYVIRKTASPLQDFVQELSTWYVRRSRDRFKGEDAADREMALRTLYTVLKTFVKIAAPVTPFITEKIYQELRTEQDPESVHLCDWPEAFAVDAQVLVDMAQVREYIEQALALRQQHKMKVRQPLQSATVPVEVLDAAYVDILKDELNVKEVLFGDAVAIDATLTPELKREGLLRELTRQTNQLRKQMKLTIQDRVQLTIATTSADVKQTLEDYREEYLKSVLATELVLTDEPQENTLKLDDGETTLTILV